MDGSCWRRGCERREPLHQKAAAMVGVQNQEREEEWSTSSSSEMDLRRRGEGDCGHGAAPVSEEVEVVE